MPLWCSSQYHPNLLVLEIAHGSRPIDDLSASHLNDGGGPAAPLRGIRGGRQKDRLGRGQSLQERLDPALREAGVELVGGEEGSLVRRLRDRPPLGELDERDRPCELSRRRGLRKRPSAAFPDQVVPLRSRQGVAPPALDGGHPRAGGPEVFF